MNILEQESNGLNEDNRMNNTNQVNELYINSNIPSNNNPNLFLNTILRVRLFVKVLFKNYFKIIGIILMIVIIYGFVEIAHKKSKYLTKF
jgi:hypothetical protein